MFKNIISHIWPVIFLTILVVFIFLTNYQPNTYLTGWDNLHPEFDFKTNIIDRSIYSVWQQYQGVGILSGNAHSADLIRQIFLWVSSILIPNNLLRYFYHFFALCIGSIGTYFLTKNILVNQKNTQIASLSAGLIYVLNLGTIQYFYAPYESFSHFYASLPWLLLITTKLLTNWTKKRLAIFVLLNLLAIPSFYIPTIFVVYISLILIICFSKIFSVRNLSHTKSFGLRSLVTLFLIFLINAYWILPFGYFLSQGTTDYTNSKINIMFTEEAFLRNQLFGNISNIFLFKSFLFDTTDFSKDMQTHIYMMQPWIDQLNRPLIQQFIYSFFGISLIGTIYAVYKKIAFARTILTIEIISLIALINDNPPTGFIYNFVQNYIPIIKQILRFPFTKFIVPMILCYSIFFGIGIYFLSQLTSKINKYLTLTILPMLTFILVFTYLPIFQGNFIYPSLRIQIPQEYFSLMHYFQTQPNAKIANLPQPTFWGWSSYKWGYRGSGFPWYGIRQPILDRAFDVWSPYNEQYYNELNTALASEDYSEFNNVLDKYNIYYLWLDDSIIIPENRDLLQSTKLKDYLQSNSEFQLVFSEGNQHIYVYKNNFLGDVKLINSTPKTIFTNPSKTIQNISSSEIVFQTISPISGTLTVPPLNKSEKSGYAKINLANGIISITPIEPTVSIDNLNYPSTSTSITVTLPISTTTTTTTTTTTVQLNDQTIDKPNQIVEIIPHNTLKIFQEQTNVFETTIDINFSHIDRLYEVKSGNNISITYPITTNSTTQLSPWEFDKPAENCFGLGKGWFKRTRNSADKYAEYSSYQASSCDYFEITTATQFSGLISQIDSQNISGRPLKISYHQNPPGNYLSEDLLPSNRPMQSSIIITPFTNIIPSHLYLEVDNYAVGNEIKTNRLGAINIIPFPLKHLQAININQNSSNSLIISQNLTTNSNPYLYISKLSTNNTRQTIVLDQALHNGWQAFLLPIDSNLIMQKVPFFFSKPLEKIASDWNNQWITPPTNIDKIVILVFWPQYIAINGFIITGITLLYFGINLYKPHK